MDITEKKIHFIAIGGSVMHELAIHLHRQGHEVTGSDDAIYDPARSKLQQYGLLPESPGWFPEKISREHDAVIIGMHAKKDNPELKEAQALNVKIYSFPEYIYSQSIDKQRIVIAGSHGKTTITAIIIHVLKHCNRLFDFVVGSQVEGFDHMIRLSDAPIIIIEGDEYPSSPLDPTPKFLNYHHHIGLISGIKWDHINVYSTFDEYAKQFDLFADATPKAGTLVYCEEDYLATVIGNKERVDVKGFEYKTHPYEIQEGKTYLIAEEGKIPLKIFGKHNMQNISAAKTILSRINLPDKDFYDAIQSFKGAAARLELLKTSDKTAVFKDFAHAPSKVEASTGAVKEMFPHRKLVACLELHTYSSLNKKFIDQYQGSLQKADKAIIYYNPEAAHSKNIPLLSEGELKEAFKNDDLIIFDKKEKLKEYLLTMEWQDQNLLMMSSGNFGGLDLKSLTDTLVK